MIKPIFKYIINLILMVFIMTPIVAKEKSLELPKYVVFDRTKDAQVPAILRATAKSLFFPLDVEDQRDIALINSKFDDEENCAGLAAPQLGISKRIIIFSVPDSPELKKWRPDLTDTMPKTIWINPKYAGVESEGYSEAYEACFSVKDLAGAVQRYNVIDYEAYTLTGQLVKGVAHGYLARVLQHEIDHLNGILFIDKVKEPGKIMTIVEYRRMRRQIESGQTTKQEL